MTSLLLALVLASSTASAAQLPAPDLAGFLVAYDHLDSLFDRSLAGTLSVDGGYLRFRAINRQLSWDIALEDIEDIRVEQVVNPIRVRVRSIVIESREGNTDVRRRIAPIDERMEFITPVVLSGVLKVRWKRYMDTRAAVSIRREQ